MSPTDRPDGLTLDEVNRNVEETRDRLDRETERLQQAIDGEMARMENALSHTRIFSQWAIGLLALIFTGLSIYAAISISSQTNLLSDFRDSVSQDIVNQRRELEAAIDRQLGSGSPPVLSTLHPDTLQPLTEGVVLDLRRQQDASEEWYSFSVVIKNEGGSTSGPIFSKVVTRAPLELPEKSSSEKEFDFETVMEPADRFGDSLPAGMSRNYEYVLDLARVPPSGNHVALLIHYYGSRESRRHVITLRVP